MPPLPLVLALDDSPFQRTVLEGAMHAAGCLIETVSTPKMFLGRIALAPPERRVAVAVVDYFLTYSEDAPEGTIFKYATIEDEVLQPLRCWPAPPPVIIYSGRADRLRQKLLTEWRDVVVSVLPKGSRKELAALVEAVREIAYPSPSGMGPLAG